MTASSPTVTAEQLSRDFGRRRAVDGLSFTLSAGESMALFGPNGAGKTTLLRLLAGLIRPTTGRLSIAGGDIRTDANVRGRVGLISHQTMLYPALTALENVEFAARLHGVSRPRESSMLALEKLAIAGRADALVRTLSRGMQQRVSIARALVHAPALLLLDEPYTGLDAGGAAALSQVLHELRAGGATMLLVTHNIAEGLAVATSASVMVAGRFAQTVATAGLDPREFADAYRAVAGGPVPAAVA